MKAAAVVALLGGVSAFLGGVGARPFGMHARHEATFAISR
jgi:hypothetical protein